MERAFLVELFSAADLPLTDKQISQFATFLEELLSWNEKFNLTAITETEEVLIKHFFDSVLGLRAFPWQGDEKVLDLGSGAGFPGIPLKIACPALRLTLVDSLQKRVGFLQYLITLLSLSETTALHGRAEELGRDRAYRENYQIVVSRAVAKLAVLAEYGLPFVQKDGVFLAYKGADAAQELAEAQKAIALLGGKVRDVKTYALPKQMGKRTIIVIEKIKECPPVYPRKPGIPARKPLK